MTGDLHEQGATDHSPSVTTGPAGPVDVATPSAPPRAGPGPSPRPRGRGPAVGLGAALLAFGPLPENNLLGAPAGSTSPSVGDGIFLMLAPLSAGEHTIHFHAEAPEFHFLLDITYHITVKPGR